MCRTPPSAVQETLFFRKRDGASLRRWTVSSTIQLETFLAQTLRRSVSRLPLIWVAVSSLNETSEWSAESAGRSKLLFWLTRCRTNAEVTSDHLGSGGTEVHRSSTAPGCLADHYPRLKVLDGGSSGEQPSFDRVYFSRRSGAFWDSSPQLTLSRFLSPLLYDVSALDPLTYAISGAALAGAAILASFAPARRAASVAPNRAC